MYSQENSRQDGENDEHGNDTAIAPWVDGASPLKAQHETDKCDDKDEDFGNLGVGKFFLEGPIGVLGVDGGGDEECENDAGDDTKRDVDDEAPPPGCAVGKCTTDKRTAQAGNAKHARGYAKQSRAPLHGRRMHQNKCASWEYACGTEARDGPAHDEGRRVRGGSAYDRAQLENSEGDEEDDFDRQGRVELAIGDLEGRRGEEIGGGVPAHILDCLELICDDGHCRGDDGLVLQTGSVIVSRATSGVCGGLPGHREIATSRATQQ